MTKPPKSNPHSDMDGIHEDEGRNVDTTRATGEDNSDIKRAAEESVGRPPRSEDESNEEVVPGLRPH